MIERAEIESALGNHEPVEESMRDILQRLVDGEKDYEMARSINMDTRDVKSCLSLVRSSYAIDRRDGLAIAVGAAVYNGQIDFSRLPAIATLEQGIQELMMGKNTAKNTDLKIHEVLLLTMLGFTGKTIGDKLDWDILKVNSCQQKIYMKWGVRRYGAIASAWRMVVPTSQGKK